MIDWAQLARVAGGGFGVTFLVLVVLSAAIWLTGLLVRRFETKGEDSE